MFKASEIPSVVFEALDEIRSYSKNKDINSKKIKELEDKISRQKYLIRTVAIGIMFATAIILIVT